MSHQTDELKEMSLGHIQWLLHLPQSTQSSAVRKWRDHHGAVPLMHAHATNTHMCTHTHTITHIQTHTFSEDQWRTRQSGSRSPQVDTWEHKGAVM